MKKLNLTLVMGMSLCMIPSLVACGGGNAKLKAPENFSFDIDTGKFKFDTVADGEYYQITLTRRINKNTYDSLKANQRTKDQATSLEVKSGETWYLWNENVCSASRLQDKRDRGYIESAFSLRTYSNTAQTAGDPIEFSQLAPGDYVLQTIANETESKKQSDPLIYTFTKAGDLATPADFKFEVNNEGAIEITAASNYLYKCLTSTGLPSKLKYEIKEGSSVLETIELDDFAWTSAIQGPTNAFTFNNNMMTSKQKSYSKDKSFDYSLNVVAEGDGNTVKGASSEGSYNHSFEVANFEFSATKAGEAYAGPDSLTIAFKCDGKDYSVNATKGEAADGVDFFYNISDAKFAGSLELKTTQSQGWGGPQINKTTTLKLGSSSLSGSYEIVEGEAGACTVKVTNVKAGGGNGGFPGGPGGGPGGPGAPRVL